MAQSWFADPELMTTAFSVSHVWNNLSKHADSLVYAHLDEVVLVNAAVTPCVAQKLPVAEKAFVHQVRICQLGHAEYIVVASDNGVQIYDAAGEHSLHDIVLKDVVDAPEEGSALFCRGIASANSEKPVILVGTSVGKVFVIGKDIGAKSGSGQEFELLDTLGDHKHSITTIDAVKAGTAIASGDDEGTILVRNAEETFEVVHRITGDGFPVTSLRFCADTWLLAGYLTGRLRIFKKETFRVHAEVAAHSRAITALDVWENHVVSVGEDTFLNVWELSGCKVSPRIKLVSSQSVANDLLSGVAFAGLKHIITATYDTTHLKLWLPE
ncbi:TPA: hypothetical protein N0F65_000271 [Lagenidium giganteum]|uniref:WD repeat-containing protein 54 beta-propeller domain-containing protein n=1 Tax=Lagenidium giganteum TaxID=4803 RepID=A0AAV2Z9G1_9STRA|nr:TPA: hypothetical protein N0F65_000271 [Lagenidium giganteum]